MIGVEHFYIYDINYNTTESIRINRQKNLINKYNNKNNNNTKRSLLQLNNNNNNNNNNLNLQDTLKAYIFMGIVTVIKWPYTECAENMACDNPIYISEVTYIIIAVYYYFYYCYFYYYYYYYYNTIYYYYYYYYLFIYLFIYND